MKKALKSDSGVFVYINLRLFKPDFLKKTFSSYLNPCQSSILLTANAKKRSKFLFLLYHYLIKVFNISVFEDLNITEMRITKSNAW